MKHFSDRLREIRKQRKLSQADLARASGLSQGAISSYETGTRKFPTGLISLARALNVNPIWLITGTGTMEPEPDMRHVPTAPGLQDVPSPQAVSVTWPFKTIRPNDYWALPDAQRRVVEQTVAAMITAMRDEQNKK